MPVTRRWLCACMLLGSLLATFYEPAQAATAAYTVAVVPALPATETQRRWQPLLDQLSRDTGFTLHDLGGRTLAFPGGSDMTTTMVLTQALIDPKIQPLLRPQRIHANGVRGVMLGKLDAVIINNYSMKLIPPGLEQKLRVICRTTPTPGPAFASAQHIPAEDALRMKAAPLHLKTTHPELLDSALMPNITEADLARDYSIFSTPYGNGTSHATP